MDYLEGMPGTIMTVVIALLILAVGAFAFFVTTNEIGFDEKQTQTFSVADPTVPKQCNLDYVPESITAVYQYNGFEWLPVSSSHYTLSGSVLTVDPGGMQG